MLKKKNSEETELEWRIAERRRMRANRRQKGYAKRNDKQRRRV